MTEPTAIIIPLINSNEPGARLAGLHVINRQHVTKGDRLCTLETTKSTVELTAENDGYLVGLSFAEGQTVQAGEILGYLADSPNWVPQDISVRRPEPQPAHLEGLRISQSALRLAQQHNLDLSHMTSGVFVTEQMVHELINQSSRRELELQSKSYKPDDLLIYGGGGHGKALIDLVRMLGTYSIAGIVDDGLPVNSSIMGISVLGGGNLLHQLKDFGLLLAVNAVGGIGDITSRIKVFEHLAKAGFACPTLIHPTAFVEPSASLADGVQVMPHAYVGSEASIGFGSIVNTGAIVSHDCSVGEYANLSPGAILAGEVSVGDATLVGMGVTVNLRVKIGSNARIGNGSTVKLDVPDGGIVRAGTIWPE